MNPSIPLPVVRNRRKSPNGSPRVGLGLGLGLALVYDEDSTSVSDTASIHSISQSSSTGLASNNNNKININGNINTSGDNSNMNVTSTSHLNHSNHSSNYQYNQYQYNQYQYNQSHDRGSLKIAKRNNSFYSNNKPTQYTNNYSHTHSHYHSHSNTSSSSASSNNSINSTNSNSNSNSNGKHSSRLIGHAAIMCSPTAISHGHNSPYYHHHPHNNHNNDSSQLQSPSPRTKLQHLCRFIQILAVSFIIYVCIVTTYNNASSPDTCAVATTSKEKLKLMHWIGRDVSHIQTQVIYDISDFTSNARIDRSSSSSNTNYGASYHSTKYPTSESKINSERNNDRSSDSIDRSSDTDIVQRDTTHSTDDLPQPQQTQQQQQQIQFSPELPKIIHHQWKDNHVPPQYQQWYTKWKDIFPESPQGYKHILWTDETTRELIANQYPFFLPTFDNYNMNIKRADAARYFILHAHGGIYADLDYEPMHNFYEYLPQNQVSLVESPYTYNEKIQNSLMSSPKGDPFWIHVFEYLIISAKHQSSVLTATGPTFLQSCMYSTIHPVYVLPCENFHRIIPHREFDQSKLGNMFMREFLTRIVPLVKTCGDYNYHDDSVSSEDNISTSTSSGDIDSTSGSTSTSGDSIRAATPTERENTRAKRRADCQFGKHHNVAGWTVESFS